MHGRFRYLILLGSANIYQKKIIRIAGQHKKYFTSGQEMITIK